MILENNYIPKISIIIPVYNGAKTLENCLKSVIAQDHNYSELIIVDNNSCDATKEIIYSFMKRYPNIHYVFEAIKSRGAARNAGIRSATGDIIAMIDADCIAAKQWLGVLVRPLIECREDVVMGSETYMVKNMISEYIQKQNTMRLERYLRHNHVVLLDTKNFAICGELLRSLMFDMLIKNVEDYEFSIRLQQRAPIYYASGALVYHYHKLNIFTWASVCFDRGYWTHIVCKKHKIFNLSNREIANFINKSWFEYLFGIAPAILSTSFLEPILDIVTWISLKSGMTFMSYSLNRLLYYIGIAVLPLILLLSLFIVFCIAILFKINYFFRVISNKISHIWSIRSIMH